MGFFRGWVCRLSWYRVRINGGVSFSLAKAGFPTRWQISDHEAFRWQVALA